MLTAITRGVSPSLQSCQLEYFEREQIDIAKACRQHLAYEQCLRELGNDVISLPSDASLPDSVFVEDPAIMLDEIGIVTRMGTSARRSESGQLSAALSEFRPLERIVEPATIEGGDVMRIGKTLYVGRSRRTNQAGIDQLALILQPYGYSIRPVEVKACLHLKTACCEIGEGRVLANTHWIDPDQFEELEIIGLPEDEPNAANVLRIGNTAIASAAFPRTAALLCDLGLNVRTLDISELAKAEAGLTCMSLIFTPRTTAPCSPTQRVMPPSAPPIL